MSPSESSSSPDLMTNLQVESTAWQALLKVLAEEEQALVAGEADHLTHLNASKLAQLQTLGNLAQARHAGLVAAGHTPDHPGMALWLAKHGRSEHHTRWRQLCEMEQQAQAMNQSIGTLIDLRLASTRQALNVLVQSASRQGNLYDQAGQAVSGLHPFS